MAHLPDSSRSRARLTLRTGGRWCASKVRDDRLLDQAGSAVRNRMDSVTPNGTQNYINREGRRGTYPYEQLQLSASLPHLSPQRLHR